MKFGSVCSGIEAASVAWAPLGWHAAWLAEIEPFPCAVLAHHYPAVPNLGDMTTLPARILAGDVEAPDVFCGGTPCQAFSVAGLRRSLDDARGNLSLTFCEIANAIDTVRAQRGAHPATVFWENVPGVLSTKDNAFGCFLAGLAGESGELQPPGGRWANAGCVFGPQRAVAWRVLDAQYFGVAQRRRRVFVVASARKGFDPATVLFEWHGVRRDTAPRREARQTAPTIPACSTAGGGLGTDFDCDGGLIAGTLQANGKAAGSATQQDAESGLLLPVAHVTTMPTMTAGGPAASSHNQTSGQMRDQYVVPCVTVDITHTLKADGFDASEDGTGRGTPLVPVSYGIRTANTSSNGWGIQEEATHTLDGAMGIAVAHPIPFDTTQVTSAANYSNPQFGDPCHPLATGAHAPAIAFPANLSGTQCASAENLSPALGAKNPTGVAYTTKLHNTQSNQAGKVYEEYSASLDRSSPPPALLTAMQVRRLTPTECERLQGFPDGYTEIPWRKKPASECPDGPRYKALGNSWAVPNVRWIGQRIAVALQALEHANDNGAPLEASA